MNNCVIFYRSVFRPSCRLHWYIEFNEVNKAVVEFVCKLCFYWGFWWVWVVFLNRYHNIVNFSHAYSTQTKMANQKSHHLRN